MARRDSVLLQWAPFNRTGDGPGQNKHATQTKTITNRTAAKLIFFLFPPRRCQTVRSNWLHGTVSFPTHPKEIHCFMDALRPRTRSQTYVRLLNHALSVNTTLLINNFLFYNISLAAYFGLAAKPSPGSVLLKLKLCCRNDRFLLIHFRKHNGMAHTNITLVWSAQSNLQTMFPYDPVLQFCYPSICDFASRLTWGVKLGL